MTKIPSVEEEYPNRQEQVDDLAKKYSKKYIIKSSPSDYVHEGLNSAEFLSHFKTDVRIALIVAEKRAADEALNKFKEALTADRLALLTELREWSVKQDWPVSKRDEGLAFQEKLGHNEAHEDLQAHLDELIKSNNI